MAAWELWEKALIPSLLHGSGTWMGDCKMAVDLCDDLQNFFWRVMLEVPESCPKVALRCETKMVGMKWRIWEEKILLLIRIKQHGTDVLCRQVYEESMKHDWPGLGQEVAEICAKIGISDVNRTKVNKSDVRKAVFEHHYEEMINVVKDQKKLEDIKEDDFREVQNYFAGKSVVDTRMGFRIRTQMVPQIPANFKNKYRVRGTESEGLVCLECDEGEIMTQSHTLTCSAWTELREGLDLSNIKDMVVFFRKLLVEREKV